MSILDFFKRISGISTPVGGIQWNNEPSEKAIIYEMLQSLGNRRLIRVSHGGFEYKAVIRSCEIIREDITTALKKVRPNSGVRSILEEMRGAIHIFQTIVEERYLSERFSYEIENPEASLNDDVLNTMHALREFFGSRLSEIGSAYEVSLPKELEYQYELINRKKKLLRNSEQDTSVNVKRKRR